MTVTSFFVPCHTCDLTTCANGYVPIPLLLVYVLLVSIRLNVRFWIEHTVECTCASYVIVDSGGRIPKGLF